MKNINMRRNVIGIKNPMFGKHHTIETRNKISEILKGKLRGDKNPSKRLEVRQKTSKALKGRKNTWSIKTKGIVRPHTSKSILKAYQEGRLKPSKYRDGGYRTDLKQYFRSRWEANYARYLNYIKIKWVYEPKVFVLYIDNKEVTYRPDFFLPDKNEYHEVKGFWFNELAKKKFEKFSMLHQSILVDSLAYEQINSIYNKLIPNWEVSHGHKY